jgi:hypothetical protein
MPLTFVQNVALDDTATSESTSTICEATAAANDRQLMMTGNWFASTSGDAGANWTFLDPFTRFPASAGGFCCDQVVLYNPRHRIWIGCCSTSRPPTATTSSVWRSAAQRSSAAGTIGTSPQRL